MANNKVQLANGTILIDITDTTANASDVLNGEYFYNASGVKTAGSLVLPQTYTVSKTLSNITTNNDDTEVLSGGSFYMDLTPSSGMVINSITVTMGGVDVTEQVFKAGVFAKSITQNGTYNAENDGLSGYSSVIVNVSGGGVAPTGTKEISISSNGTTTEDVTNYANAEINVNVPNSYTSSDEGKVVSSGALVSQTSSSTSVNGTINTTTINSLTVNVPTGTARSSSDLTVSGATVTVPAGLYSAQATKTVASGTEGTPIATKGTVNNHSISVTPSVTNTAGYISGSTKTGTTVTVSASELVSGSETKTENGTYDVTNLAELIVNIPNTSKNVQIVQGTTRTSSSTLTAIGASLTVSKTGTYDVYWSAARSSTSSSYTFATRLYIDGTAYGSENTSWSNSIQNNHLSNVSLTANQTIRVYGRESRNSSYYVYAPTLIIIEK